MKINFCSRCKLDIPEEMQQNEIVVCPHCGLVKSSNESKLEANISKQFIKFTIGTSLLFIAIFMHSVSWGPYFIEVIPPKARSLAGMASAEDYSRLAKMCKELKDLACVEQMLGQYVKLDAKNLEVLAELGVLQASRKHFPQAVNTLGQYFKLGGQNTDVSYTYAKALVEIGKMDNAIYHLEKIRSIKPNALSIAATHDYVQMLIKSGRTARAMAVIQSIRSQGATAALFMDAEMRKLASQ